MLKVAIVGAAGRMGRRLVANILEDSSMQLTGAVETASCPLIGQDAGLIAGVGPTGVNITADLAGVLPQSDVLIIFATGNIYEMAKQATASNCASVIGTTALDAQTKQKLHELIDLGARIVLAPNMSVGVNLLFHLVKEAAQLLDNYDIEITEMHHNQKKDAPSGTAVRLAEVICNAKNWNYAEVVKHGRDGITGARPGKEIGIHALRGGDVVGDHTVVFATSGERVELTHKASNRDTFALGALRAAKFIAAAKPGMYDMQQVLNLK